jgi:hypothetical protein
MKRFLIEQIASRIIIFIIIICIVLFLNYWYGKHFHPCDDCTSNEVFLVDVPELDEECVAILENEIRSNGTRLNPELNFSNAQGRKLNFNKLPSCIKKFYETPEFEQIVSKTVNERVTYAPDTEQYRIFTRLYEDDDDFLEWHYDNNFTKGNRYTLVIPVLVDECNTAEFMIRDRRTKKESVIKVPVGQGVLYNGTEVYHKITQQTKGCRRMVVIIPFYANYEKGFLGDMRQFLRNITYQQLTL